MTVKFESHITEAIQKIQAESLERMEKAVITVRDHTATKLTGQRTGRIYKVPGTQRTYTASSPGEPPAIRLGDLKDSVKWTIETQGKEIIGKVGTDKEYGARLEFGYHDTDSKGRRYNMAARPWLQKSFDETKDEVIAIFNRHMEL